METLSLCQTYADYQSQQLTQQQSTQHKDQSLIPKQLDGFSIEQIQTLLNIVIRLLQQHQDSEHQHQYSEYQQKRNDYHDQNSEHTSSLSLQNTPISILLNDAIELIHQLITQQLQCIFQHADFRALEAAWRGVRFLTSRSKTYTAVKFKLAILSQQELTQAYGEGTELTRTWLYRQLYTQEFCTPGGEPIAVLIGDYYFSHRSPEMACLRQLSRLAALAYCPFLTSISPALFGLDSWDQLDQIKDLTAHFSTQRYAAWQRLRHHSDSKFVILTCPRVLAREPYTEENTQQYAFTFEEIPLQSWSLTSTGPTTSAADHASPPLEGCWMNCAYALAAVLSRAFNEHGFCTAIRGVEGGGKLEELPLIQLTQSLNRHPTPTEFTITDLDDATLNTLGLLPLCHYKHTASAVFFGANGFYQCKRYNSLQANLNEQISARLPYIMATSRFAHYLKLLARDKIGALNHYKQVEDWLNQWLRQYVNSNPNSKHALKAKYPLADAYVEVTEADDCAGHYQAELWLRPWLQMEQLTATIKMVAQIPNLGAKG